MTSPQLRAGLDYLDTVTTLLQRARAAHPTHGLYEAAELQWFWTIPRSTDDLGQLFWFDAAGQPEAAFVVADFGDGSSALYEDPTVIVISMPDATSEWLAEVVDRGLAHLSDHGIGSIELEVDRDDAAMQDVLTRRGFKVKGEALDLCWLDVNDRPEVSPLEDGYRLMRRSDDMGRPHHMVNPRRPDVEQRLQQTSLYRPELDLVVYDADDHVAAYGMFWFDPATAVGVVEPMRTADDHQSRGLARHVLTSGVDMLATAGAERVSIGYMPDNLAAGHLYRSVGFEPTTKTLSFARSNTG